MRKSESLVLTIVMISFMFIFVIKNGFDDRALPLGSTDSQCGCASELSRSKFDAVGGWKYNKELIATKHVWFDVGFAREILRIVTSRTPKKENGGKPSIGDIGAGVGQFGAMLEYLGDESVEWHGFDGGSNVNEFCGQRLSLIDKKNYTVPKVCFLDASVPIIPRELEVDGAPFDWIISIEVGEHIPKEYQFIFIDNLIRLSKYGIILTWAVPNQGGHGHVNELENEDVVKMMELRNMHYLPRESTYVRHHVDHLGWLKNTVMVFSKFQGKDRPTRRKH